MDKKNNSLLEKVVESDFDYYLSTEKLLKKIYQISGRTPMPIPKYKSVSSLPAQTATQCLAVNEVLREDLVVKFCALENRVQADFVKAITELLYVSGCRISEALNVKIGDVMENGQIRINGLKGSSNRIVQPVLYRQYWLRLKRNGTSIPTYFSRYYFYRIYKKFGIYNQISKGQCLSVTHSLRYNYINQLLLSGMEAEEIQNIIGHRSVKSTLYYISNLTNNG